MRFTLSDLEALKRTGATLQDVHYNVSNTIQHSQTCAADVRTLDRITGRFEIVLTGTLSKDVLEKKDM